MKLKDIATVLRSKNAGPFTVTLDIMNDTEEKYLRIKNSGAITAEKIAELYNVDPATVSVYDSPLAYSMKVSIKRPVHSGSLMDCDVYGAQQQAPLYDIEID